jgi:hypothetical protein
LNELTGAGQAIPVRRLHEPERRSAYPRAPVALTQARIDRNHQTTIGTPGAASLSPGVRLRSLLRQHRLVRLEPRPLRKRARRGPRWPAPSSLAPARRASSTCVAAGRCRRGNRSAAVRRGRRSAGTRYRATRGAHPVAIAPRGLSSIARFLHARSQQQEWVSPPHGRRFTAARVCTPGEPVHRPDCLSVPSPTPRRSRCLQRKLDTFGTLPPRFPDPPHSHAIRVGRHHEP